MIASNQDKTYIHFMTTTKITSAMYDSGDDDGNVAGQAIGARVSTTTRSRAETIARALTVPAVWGVANVSRVWVGRDGKVRIYVTRKGKDIGYIAVDDDGALNCDALTFGGAVIGAALEPVAAVLGVQVYGY